MGLIECPPGHSRLIASPHPVTDEGQENRVAQLLEGEKLGAFLRREVPNWTGDAWEVRINGVLVPVEVMERVRPRDGTLIEVRSLTGKQALYIVAMVALTYFTFGLGSAGGLAGLIGGTTGMIVASAVFVAGSILINKVLGPKPQDVQQDDRNTVYTIGASRNQMRPYQPLALTFGRVKYAPDILSQPYTYFEGDDQYVAMVLTPGVNVHRVEELYLGDSLLSSFEGVQVYYAGFSGMPEQQIPLYTDADTINGGELNRDRTYVQRTTPARTVRIQINIGYILGDKDKKGKPYTNIETVEVQYCPVGTGAWTPLVSRNFANSDYNPHRATLARDVPEGQYDVRVRILGRAVHEGGSNGQAQFQWENMVAVQADTTDYTGIPRIGIRMKASGQLQNAPDEIRCVCVSRPVPVWTGTEWVTKETSNTAAHLLAYARGINDTRGNRLAGIGLADDMIDVPGMQAFMLHCEAEQFTYDFVVKDARNHDEMVSALALAGFGQVSWSTGRLSPVWAADEQPLSGVVGMANIKEGQFQVDYTLASAADGIEYTYYDATDWSTRTLRIPAPGVDTMLNPAQVTGEGVTSEAQAAMLARWHLAQSLYQYKDISYATDLEHLSYRRMSMLSLSHDMTQWGFSGRVVAARIEDGVVTVDLDEPVRAPATGKAYIGLRVPGERNYRVFEVRAFQGTASRLRLVGAWPSDAALPGDTDANPAHDTTWCYDFKATPGYRVRVVGIEPESDLQGARVSVVPEGPEFWEYVRTGRYIRPPNESLLQTRPVASDLVVTERQVVQGDTVFTELVAQWEVSGPVGDTVVQMADPNGQLQEVARTTTRSAAWRIPGAGTYQIAVRPFAPDGRPGIATGTIYSTIGADAPPVLVDLFDVQERSGGVRLYTWGWLEGTTRSADFAGVEIRVTSGKVAAPNWDAMEPVGNADGYHTAPFEAVVPASGDWTFAARSRNTSGTLSTGMRVVAKTLGANLGEQIGGIGDDLGAIGDKVAQEISDRFEADAKVAADAAADAARQATEARQAAIAAASSDATTKANNARTAAIATAAADATAKANAARDEAVARADAAMAQAEALAAEIAEIVGAPEWETGATYNAGWLVRYEGGLYRARVQTTGQNPAASPAVWEKLGDYDSVGEALAAALAATTQLATDLSAEVTRLDAVVARLPSGNGALAAQATVAANAAASVQRDEALASRQTATEAKMPIDGGRAASEARANQIEQTAATAAAANASRLALVEAKVPADGGRAASAAQLVAAESAAAAANSATADRLAALQATVESGQTALVGLPAAKWIAANASHAANLSVVADGSARSGVVLRVGDNAGNDGTNIAHPTLIPFDPVRLYRVRTRARRVEGTGALYIWICGKDAAGTRWVYPDGRIVQGVTPGSGFYILPSATPALGQWVEATYYVRGVASATSGAGTLASPRALREGSAFLSVGGFFNNPNATGVQELDYIVVEDAESDSVLARLVIEEQVRAEADVTQASRTAAMEARFPAGSGKVASEARLDLVEQAAASASAANASRIDAIAARVPTGTGTLATEAQLIADRAASVARDQANASATDVVRASLDALAVGGRNYIRNSATQPPANYLGSVLAVTRNVAVAEWGATDAMSIVSSGGTHLLKAYWPMPGTPHFSEPNPYTVSLWIRNDGDTPMIVLNQRGSANQRIEPGFSGRVIVKGPATPATSNPSLQLRALTASDSIAVTVWRPKGELGTTATDWSPSPDDVDAAISGAATALQATDARVAIVEGRIVAEAARTSALEAKAPADGGRAASEARANTIEQAAATAAAANASRLTSLEAKQPADGGRAVSEARVVAAEQAAATANSATASRVTAVEGKLPAGGGRAASEASVTQLQSVVTNQGQQLAQQITTVDTKAGGAQTTATQALAAAEGTASAIVSVRNQSSVDNLFPNAEFRSVANANRPSNIDIAYAVGRSVVALYMAGHEDEGVPVGKRAFIVVSNVNTAGSPMIVAMLGTATDYIAVEPNTEYIFSYYGSGAESMAARATTFTASGASIADIDSPFLSAGGGNSLSAYARPFVRFTTPANCRWVRPQFYTIASQSSGQVFSRFTAPQFEKTKPGQTEPSPWAPGAAGLSQVTQDLRAGLEAKAGLYLTNGNLISGYESVNDGVRSEFNVLASVFRIIAPGGGARAEYSDSNHRAYDAQGRLRARFGAW